MLRALWAAHGSRCPGCITSTCWWPLCTCWSRGRGPSSTLCSSQSSEWLCILDIFLCHNTSLQFCTTLRLYNDTWWPCISKAIRTEHQSWAFLVSDWNLEVGISVSSWEDAKIGWMRFLVKVPQSFPYWQGCLKLFFKMTSPWSTNWFHQPRTQLYKVIVTGLLAVISVRYVLMKIAILILHCKFIFSWSFGCLFF